MVRDKKELLQSPFIQEVSQDMEFRVETDNFVKLIYRFRELCERNEHNNKLFKIR